MFKKNLGTVLIAAVAVAVILAVTGIILYVTQSTYSLALNQQRQAMTQATGTALSALDMYMGNVKGMATTLAERRVVREALDGDMTHVGEELRRYLNEAKSLWGVLVFDGTGRIVAGLSADGEDLAGKSRAERDYVRAILSGQDLFVPRQLLEVP